MHPCYPWNVFGWERKKFHGCVRVLETKECEIRGTPDENKAAGLPAQNDLLS